MNTEKSDKLVAEWTKKVNPLKRASATVHRTFSTPPDELFPLLCPTTEYDWIPHWTCELLHSNSGYAEYNCIFRTALFGTNEVWVCTRFEPNKSIDYTRYSNDVSSKLEISLTDNHDGTVTGRWVMTASALNENGNPAVAELQSAKQHIEQLIDALEHYVNTGQVVS
jgi:uncharacterized protein YndB with AHSA1/START domain